jgi:hypothetical protein
MPNLADANDVTPVAQTRLRHNERNAAGHDRRTLNRIASLENPHDVLNRVAAGVRSATLNKLLFDDAETAIILGTSTETLKVWRREGRGPAWVRLGDSKLVRYTLDALRDYVASLEPRAA